MSQKSKIKSKLNGNELDLSLMDLKEVPVKELVTIPKGTHIDLSCNHLTCLPASFCDLTYIVQLDLSKNQIKQLPDNFGNLKNLQRLDLFSNQLKILPESFYKLEKLKWLDVKDNPLDAQLKEIAGDFITSEDYRWCAKKIVEFMTNVHNELEKERERRRNKQQNKVASKKAKEEAKQEKLRQEKKAAKEKRRTELIEQQKKQQQKSKDQRKNNQQIKQKNDLKPIKTAKDRSTQSSKSKSVGKKNSSSGHWLWLLAIIILIFAVLLWRYTGNNFTKDEVLKATVAIRNDAWHFIQVGSAIGKRMLLQMMQSLKDFTEFIQELWRKM